VFEQITSGISQLFSDVMPHTFCIGCFLKGLVQGAALALVAVAAIAALPAELAIVATVGLAALGVYGISQLAKSWGGMSDGAKSEAIGNIVGGLIGGAGGPKILPETVPVPGIRFLSTPEGVVVPVLTAEEVAVSATASQGAAAGLGGGGTAAMMSSSGGGGGTPKRVTNPKHHPNSESPEPSNAQELYDKSIEADNGTRWAKDADGTIHRFSKPSNGESHWNGSTEGAKPIRSENIPPEIRKVLK